MTPERSVEHPIVLPKRPTLPALRALAADCRACDLWTAGTQTVFGAGHARSPLMLVGEQPGNEEDLEGQPFVGPAGQLLDRLLQEAGIERSRTYVTNAVKHFKWEQRGKRRIHQRPNAREVQACRPWIEAEIAVVKPKVIVCLGATAAHALLGPSVSITRQHGEFVDSPLAPGVTLTVHPSAILRSRSSEARHLAMEQCVADLRGVIPFLG